MGQAFLSAQQDMRDLLTELVQTQKVVSWHLREGVAALQDMAAIQKQQTDAIVALAKVIADSQLS